MPFDTLSPRLKEVATRSLNFCRGKYGVNGLKIEEGIHDSILWRPSFFLKPTRTKIVAVEVDDNLYPNSLKGAAHEIGHFDFPISVFQACSLEAYLNDPNHRSVSLLKKHGFGIITVDGNGNASMQHNCIPLAQHISPDEFDRRIQGLTPKLKVLFRTAYDVYQTNEGQGLQEAGQIVEAIVTSLAEEAHRVGVVPANTLVKPLAFRIDDLYGKNTFQNYRAALGGARQFVQDFRNTASHPARSAKEAAEKIRKCKAGFLDAIGIAVKLRQATHDLGYHLRMHIA
ncbi:hypothetical protein ACVILI_000864 [Mesorhizobium sp. USDA 4775]|uniref:hypothetical protein n=1 Tax=Mesorhizobium jarvisii TaxID=1777867 RepID=UPI0011DCBFE2|nr:hypothetical protein [Mesorhizobium jarvisii]MCH4555515.1 hypothetical protein [Mesorhizobium jarvisii]QGU20628.1 hypothetical protein MCHK_08675 [Mesorhizobium huakuii 7653R]